MDDTAEISESEALLFLKDVLGISSPESKLATNSKTFLEEILRGMQHHIPFQTVRGIARPQSCRRLPTIGEIKADVQGRLGGLCYQLNTFLWMLLRAIGFDVSLVTSDVSVRKNVHNGVVVCGLTHRQSSHLVDIGTGHPTYRAIPLDFEHVSPEYCDSFLQYRFIRREAGIVIRQHTVDSDPSNASRFVNTEDGWFSYFLFRVNQPVSLSHFDQAMTDIFTKVDSHPPFLKSVRCVAFPHGRLVCIKDTTVLLEDDQGKVHKTYLRSRDEIIQAYGRHFPQIPKDMISAALDDELVTLDFTKEQI